GGHAGAKHIEQLRSAKLLDGKGNAILSSSNRNGLFYIDLHKTQDFD
ncbi:unnamed protein product, partial [marine sediment metagenome]